LVTMRFSLLTSATLASTILAAPAPHFHNGDASDAHHTRHGEEPSALSHGATTEWAIHPSCNLTETRQLRNGLREMVELVEHASAHILRHGNDSAHYRKYFGNLPTGEAIGWYERIARGDRGATLFRCDDPDGNCQLPGKPNTPFMRCRDPSPKVHLP
jgi:hypothetical protein